MTTDVVLADLPVAKLGMFHRWQPSRPIAGESAVLFLTHCSMKRVGETWNAQGHERLCGQVKAVFDDFIENGRQRRGVFEESGGRNGIAQMKIYSPDPGARLFGGFIHSECFVGLRLLLRSELPFKPTGQKGVIDYKSLGQALVKQWCTLLPGIERVRIKDMDV